MEVDTDSEGNDNSKSYTKNDFFKILGIDDLKDLKDKATLKKALMNLKQVDSKELKKFLESVPELIEVMKEIIFGLNNISTGITEVQKARWEAFTKIAETKVLSGEEILKFAELIKEMEIPEITLKEKIAKYYYDFGKVVLVIFIFILGWKYGGGLGGSKGSQTESD